MKTWTIWEEEDSNTVGAVRLRYALRKAQQFSVVQPRILKDMPVPYMPLFNPDSASITIMNHRHLIALWGHLAQGLVNTTGEGPHSFRGRTPGFLRRSTRRLCALLKAGLSGLLKCLSENCSHTATAPGWWVWKHSFHLWKVENQRTFVS